MGTLPQALHLPNSGLTHSLHFSHHLDPGGATIVAPWGVLVGWRRASHAAPGRPSLPLGPTAKRHSLAIQSRVLSMERIA